MTPKTVLQPGATIGILGGGQLGQMLAIEAKRMGYRVIVLDPTKNSPASQVADEQVIAEFSDVNAALKMAEHCDVITYEFENIDVDLVKALTKKINVFPGPHVLEVTQHRGDEKTFIRDIGIDVADFALIDTEQDLAHAQSTIGFPAVIKTCRFGYDGKGQAFINNAHEATAAFEKFSGQTLIWEKCIPFVKEVSVICTRNQHGDCVTYPVAENTHANSILDTTLAPALIDKQTAKNAESIAKTIAEKLDVIGTFAVEMFLLENQQLLVNELAPRPHNSGHYTIDACVTSQFENQLRAICNLPLGSTELVSPVVMVNILGEQDNTKIDKLEQLLNIPNTHFHWYSKHATKAARKMGHFTVTATTTSQAMEVAQKAKTLVSWSKPTN